MTPIVGDGAKRSLQVNTPGGTGKERSLMKTRHLSFFHVCQPCRNGVTTRSELTSSTLNAGEFERASYPERTLVECPDKQRWGTSYRLQGELDRLYYMTNAYVDPLPLPRAVHPFYSLQMMLNR